jgi:hypothetical protein
MKERHVGISLGNIGALHDGLGEFSWQIGQRLAARAARWRAEHGNAGPEASLESLSSAAAPRAAAAGGARIRGQGRAWQGSGPAHAPEAQGA